MSTPMRPMVTTSNGVVTVVPPFVRLSRSGDAGRSLVGEVGGVVLAEVVLQLLERASPGLRAQPPDEEERARVDQREQPERQRRAERPDEQGEHERDDGVG